MLRDIWEEYPNPISATSALDLDLDEKCTSSCHKNNSIERCISCCYCVAGSMILYVYHNLLSEEDKNNYKVRFLVQQEDFKGFPDENEFTDFLLMAFDFPNSSESRDQAEALSQLIIGHNDSHNFSEARAMAEKYLEHLGFSEAITNG